MKYKYAVEYALDDFYNIESNWNENQGEYLAEDCAEDYHSNHDGWEAYWPLTITLAREDETIIGTFSVEREHKPEFFATCIKSLDTTS